MRKIGLILLLYPILFFGQSRNTIAIGLLTECEKVKNDNNYKNLITIANKGIQLSNNDTYLLARFNFYKAYGYEYDNNQYEKAIPYFEASWRYAQKKSASERGNPSNYALELLVLFYQTVSKKRTANRIHQKRIRHH